MTIDPTTLPASPYAFSVYGLKLQKRDPIVDTRGELWTCSHTAKRGPSDTYYKERIKYHPYMAEVLG